MTETQRAAMQQALEFCEELQGGCTDSDDGTVEAITVWCPEVISALRAALAEPEPPIWQRLAEIGASAPAGTWDAPVGPPASPSLTPAQEHADELLDALKALLHDQAGARSATAALRAALAEPEQGRKKRKPKNSTTPLGIVCFEAYARSEVGSNRWDIAAEAVRAALAASEANEGRDE